MVTLSAMYLVKTPFWIKKIFNKYIWDVATEKNKLFLSFDDGPHPIATPFVLNQLENYKAKGTFFCIGKNVIAHPAIYAAILDGGHAIGNHTHNHFNGWKVNTDSYINNLETASAYISSNLFRPPYGRIKTKQALRIIESGYKIIMWDVLSGDFDIKCTPSQCLQNVTNNAESGSIIVFHDSEKAFRNLSYALPGVLEFFSNKGFQFETLNDSILTHKKGSG